jgi:pimeloyl-ACP methyl ester carboxylesterase
MAIGQACRIQPRPAGRERDHWVTVASRPMFAREAPASAPDAPVVVLVHGLVVSSWYMMPTAVRLAPRYHVYAPDLPGFGRSAAPPAVLSIPELADALVGWLDACQIDRAALVGNSFGCQVIVDLAMRYPKRADRLVLLGPTVDAAARTLWQQFFRLLEDIRQEPPMAPWNYLADLWKANLRRGFGTLWHTLDDRLEQKLPHVAVPALVVKGELDPLVPQAWAEQVASLLPQGELVVVPGGTHTINASAPDAFVWSITPFLEPMQAQRRLTLAPARSA